jgi:hypothetical protein
VAAHNDARHQAAADALRMQQRVCCVLWDLDNLLPPRPAQNLLPALREVQAVLRGLGAATVSVQLFANGHTMSRGEQRWVRGISWLLGWLVGWSCSRMRCSAACAALAADNWPLVWCALMTHSVASGGGAAAGCRHGAGSGR